MGDSLGFCTGSDSSSLGISTESWEQYSAHHIQQKFESGGGSVIPDWPPRDGFG
jgi:hypothetical protein